MAYKNKEDQSRAAKRHYLLNKDKYLRKAYLHNKKTRCRNKIFIDNIKESSPCVDCGESNPIVLEFDHVRGVKKENVSDMVRQSYCLKTIQEEIDKCEVRCANCHRIVTHERRQEKREKIEEAQEEEMSSQLSMNFG
tara:strand:- start:2776 stop:3186 length:411 start_codon:yes stop_codon:yes gene_type:complete